MDCCIMIEITPNLFLRNQEVKIIFVRSSGPGGQNVNKLATAAQLRFNVIHSPSLPEEVRLRLLSQLGNKTTQAGDLIIKASRYRTQERNRQDAIDRLIALLKRATIRPIKRKKTRPTLASHERRLNAKKFQGKIKVLRRNKLPSGE
jgi:ribosome-associated protein